MKKTVLLTLVITSLIISGCKNLSLFQKAENSLADSVNVQDESGELTVLEYSKERTAVELIFNAELAAQGRYAMPSSLSGVIDSTDYSVYASVSSDRGVTYKQYKCECTGSTMRFSNYAISTDTAVTLKIRCTSFR
ncbi:MAG: hypothetical protein MJ169_07845 [Treponema sp.]|nr:hypothetical protein [Treponema sp.]